MKHNFDVKYKTKLTINVNYTIFVYNQFLPFKICINPSVAKF